MLTNHEKQTLAFHKLREKGFTVKEAVDIRKAFMDFGVDEHKAQQIVRDGEFYKNKDVSGYLFHTEQEAVFAGHLFALMPQDTKKDNAMTVFSIILKLLNIESEWSFNNPIVSK